MWPTHIHNSYFLTFQPHDPVPGFHCPSRLNVLRSKTDVVAARPVAIGSRPQTERIARPSRNDSRDPNMCLDTLLTGRPTGVASDSKKQMVRARGRLLVTAPFGTVARKDVPLWT